MTDSSRSFNSGFKDWLDFMLDWAFRPLFLAACGYGIVAILLWTAFLKGKLLPTVGLSPMLWHSYEMVFGFAGAALGGFILTAVPSWSNTTQCRGTRLLLIVLLWLGARVAMSAYENLPLLLVALLNLVPTALILAAAIPPLWQDPSRRHRIFIPILLGYLFAQAGVFVELAGFGQSWGLAQRCVVLGGHLLTLAIIVTVTRISMVVVFRALEEQQDTESRFMPLPPRRNLAAFSFLLYALCDFFWPGQSFCGWIAIAAGTAQMERLADWHVGRVLLKPYVAIIYSANLWIGLGLIGVGYCYLAEPALASHWRHGLYVGAMGSAILAVFSIAGLRHSGLDFPIPKPAVAAFFMVSVASVFRVLANHWPYGFEAAALGWCLALALYLSCYFKILTVPNVDKAA